MILASGLAPGVEMSEKAMTGVTDVGLVRGLTMPAAVGVAGAGAGTVAVSTATEARGVIVVDSIVVGSRRWLSSK